MAKSRKLWAVSIATIVAAIMLIAGVSLASQKALAEDSAKLSASLGVTLSVSGDSNGASAKLEKSDYSAGEKVVLKWSGGKDGDNLVVPTSITFNNQTWGIDTLLPITSIQTANTEYKRRMGSDGTMTTFDNLQSYVAKTHSLTLADSVTLGGPVTVTFQKVSPVYRLYNMISSEHLFTTQKAEYDNFVQVGQTDQDFWIGEGVSWLAPAAAGTGTSQVYRLYNAGLGALGHSSHYYTADEAEKTSLETEHGWADDGTINGFMSGGSTAIWTCYNEALGSAHHYTSSKTEWQGLAQHGWALEEDKNGTNPVKTPEGVFQCTLATQWSFDGNYYTVRHILDNDTAHAEVQFVSANAGTTTEAAAKDFPGYTAGTVTQQSVNADNTTQVDINYTSNSYTIKFDANGTGTAPADQTGVKYGTSIKDKKPADLSDTTKTFLGWYYDSNRTHAVNWDNDTMPATDMTIYAAWEDPNTEVVITFDTDGGTPAVDKVVLTKGTAIGDKLPASAGTKTGYTFDGWYNGETKVDASTTFSENATLKAKWTAETPAPPAGAKTISFDTRGNLPTGVVVIVTGDGFSNDGKIDDKKTDDSGKLANLPEPKIDGYVFKGWANATDGTDVSNDTIYTADTNLKAKWAVVVTFDVNGGTGVLTPNTYEVLVGTGTLAQAGLTSLPDAGTRDGYSGYKWIIPGGDELTEAKLSTQNFNSKSTVRAEWQIAEGTETVTITLNNIKPYSDEKSTIKVPKGKKPQRPADPYDGTSFFEFVNWYTVAPSEGQDETKVFNWDQEISADTNAYAGWAGIVTIKFESNVPTGKTLVDNGMVKEQRIKVGANFKLPECKWVLNDESGNDYGFMGWGYANNTSTVDYRDRDVAIKHTVRAGDTVTLNAIWTTNPVGDYWIAPSKYIITGATATPDTVYYNNPLSGVVKTETDIKADLEVIKDTSKADTQEYKNIVAAYESYMNNDDYHLYTQLANTTPYSSGSFNENDYVEFRIINVGGHKTKKASGSSTTEEDDGSIITFMMTHSLNTGYGINKQSIKTGGWTVSDLRNSITEASGEIYKTFKASFVEKLRSVTKYTREGWTSGSPVTKSSTIKSTADKFFLLSYGEVSDPLPSDYTSTDNYDKEGNQYQFFKAKGFTNGNGFKGLDLQGKKRDGSSYPNDTTWTINGSWWLRSVTTSSSQNYEALFNNGGNIDGYSQNSKCGIVLCFTVGRN